VLGAGEEVANWSLPEVDFCLDFFGFLDGGCCEFSGGEKVKDLSEENSDDNNEVEATGAD